MTRPDFPLVIDSSLMSAFRACPRKAFLEYFEHWKSKTPNVHLHAGKCFASALEAARRAFYFEGAPKEDAIAEGLLTLMREYGDFECPPESAKSLPRMAGAFEYYMDKYPMDQDHIIPLQLPTGEQGVEFSFAEPIDLRHPQTGDPLIFVGRMDMLGRFAEGTYGYDDKTTSSLGASWAKQWDLRGQFTSYVWGAREAEIKIDGFIVRGISILKTKYETQEAITYRPDWMIDRWYEQTLHDIKRMIECWESGYWDFNLDESCNHYGGCQFRQVCLVREPQTWLEGSFQRLKWDPVTRTETPVE